MMMLGSKYGADAQGGLDVVGYFTLEWVPKPTPSGVKLIRRDPAPEVLLGDPVLARAATRLAPGALKYRSLILSFAPEDIDAAAFNAGCPDSRAQVDFALQLFCEVAFAGIPKACRPPLFVSTHTHTERMELNIMVPRWVRRSDGAIRSFNPDPPGPASRACWDAFEDLLNARFGWANPRDPASQRLITLPSWLLKQKAEALRSGLPWTPSARERVTDALITAVKAREIANRSELLDYIEKWCSHNDMVVHSASAVHVTIGVAGADVKDRIRLQGPLLAAEGPFSALLHRSEPTALQRSQQRRMVLERPASNCSRHLKSAQLLMAVGLARTNGLLAILTRRSSPSGLCRPPPNLFQRHASRAQPRSQIMTAVSPPTSLSNLTSLERVLLLRLQALHQIQTETLAQQDQKIAALEAEVRAGQAAVTRLIDLLTCLLGPVDPGAS
jgi:hypothetical protein